MIPSSIRSHYSVNPGILSSLNLRCQSFLPHTKSFLRLKSRKPSPDRTKAPSPSHSHTHLLTFPSHGKRCRPTFAICGTFSEATESAAEWLKKFDLETEDYRDEVGRFLLTNTSPLLTPCSLGMPQTRLALALFVDGLAFLSRVHHLLSFPRRPFSLLCPSSPPLSSSTELGS